MTAFKLITPPSSEPVTLDEAKAQARIDTSVDDALVTGLIAGAWQWAEQYTGRAFLTQTWQLWLDLWPAAFEVWWDGVRDGSITGLDEINYVSLPRAVGRREQRHLLRQQRQSNCLRPGQLFRRYEP